MSRPGITYMEVAEVAEELLIQGKNPTIEQIRLKLGSGSSTTISNHLRSWKDKLAGVDISTVKEKLPQDLMAIVKGLWEKVVDQSQEKIEIIENQSQKTIDELEQALKKYKANNRRWQELHQQWLHDKETMVNENHALVTELEKARKEIEMLAISNQSYLQKIEERDSRINEWRVLHEQTQRQFVMLEKDMQAQFRKERDVYQDQMSQFKSAVAARKDRINQLESDLAASHERCHELDRQNAIINQQNREAASVIKEQKVNLTDLQKIKDEQQQTAYYWQKLYQDNQLAYQHKEEQIINILADNKHYERQLTTAKAALLSMEQELTQLKKRQKRDYT